MKEKQTINAYEINEKELLFILDELPCAVWIINSNKIVFANAKFIKMLGPTKEDFCYKKLHGIEAPCKPCITENVLSLKENSYVKEILYKNKYYDIYAYPFYEDDGSLSIMKIAIDITERKLTNLKISQLDNLKIIGEMASSIAHEIRNPLTSIRGFMQIFSSRLEYQKDKEYFDLMMSEIDRVNNIVTDMLALTKNKQINKQAVNLNDRIQSIYPLLLADAIGQGKNIILDKGDISDVLLDVNLIYQLLLNLVRNGLDAMQEDKSLTIRTYQDNNEVVLEIIDQGHGISSEVLEQFGTLFVTTKENGTGLGLSTCLNIVKMHNAKWNFISNANGTTVCIRFSETV